MLASEYIRQLQELIQRHGDLEMVDSSDELMSVPEEVDGAFVGADRA